MIRLPSSRQVRLALTGCPWLWEWCDYGTIPRRWHGLALRDPFRMRGLMVVIGPHLLVGLCVALWQAFRFDLAPMLCRADPPSPPCPFRTTSSSKRCHLDP